MLLNKRFLHVYAKVLTVGVRVVAAWFGFVFLAFAIGGYVARPVREEDLSRMQEDIGRSHVSELRTNRPKKSN